MPGRLKIVGIGPGAINHLTQSALEAIKEADVIVGYKSYIKLLSGLTDNKEIVSFAMTEEVKRARYAIKKAREGKNVCVVSSGDAGIYGMAGLILELLETRIEIEIIPGISAASSCASLLGAPLAHDFAVISLSDLLTDRRMIEERIRAASMADFVIVFYNPKSKKRPEPLKAAWRILMRYKSADTPVGIARNSYRANGKVEITKLKNMLCSKIIDMFTTIIVGNSKTYLRGGYMITPRGYEF